MNVLVDMFIFVLARSMGGRVCISGVDFGCFLLYSGIAKASVSVKTNWTPRFYVYIHLNIQYIPIPEGVRRENKI